MERISIFDWDDRCMECGGKLSFTFDHFPAPDEVLFIAECGKCHTVYDLVFKLSEVYKR